MIKLLQYLILAIIFILVPLSFLITLIDKPDWSQEIVSCNEGEKNESEKINCWFVIIQKVFIEQGTEEAFTVFEKINNDYDVFANTGCHRHAHRVGDLSYYYDYLDHKDLRKTEFPKNAVACGYGFYHGFFEHLIQDNPDPDFVTETCEYMRENLYEVAPAISQTCYHGSGHGFVLAELDKITESKLWTETQFTSQPLQQCERLAQATLSEISECRQGVYNVLADWMADKEYGLSYNADEPFAFCDTQLFEHQYDCYYEMAQKIGIITEFSPLKSLVVAEKALRKDLQQLILDVAIAGLVQHNPKGDQSEILNECRLMPENFGLVCFKSIVSGLIEHNPINDDFASAFGFCARKDLLIHETEACYGILALKLERFYTKNEIEIACQSGVYSDILCTAITENES